MINYKTVLCTLALGISSAGLAQASNLVANGGFETGDFTGWSTISAPLGSDFGVTPFGVHSGSFDAEFGAVSGLDDTIYQVLSTNAGTSYTLSFWLDASQGVEGHFVATVGGATVLDTAGVAGGYQEYSYSFVATSSSTALAFTGNTPPSFYHLDDVSVSAVPEPSTAFMAFVGLAALGAYRRRRQG